MDTFSALALPAFFAGLLTFLAPCTLPLVPGYLAFISGASFEDLKDPGRAGAARFKIFLNGLFFMIGFSAVFIFLGTAIGFVGASFLAPYRLWLSRIGGAFIILFGLFMLDALKVPFLNREKKFPVPLVFERGKPVNSFILGSAFALGWTPCVGPILGSVLLIASVSTTAFQGGALLAIFSAGMAVPFLAIALGVGSAGRIILRASPYLRAISITGGLLLIFLGVLLVLNKFTLIIYLGYYLLQFIHYDKLLNYL